MSNYLVHFNKNHDKLGQFTFGDGDGDGKKNDHGQRSGRPPKKSGKASTSMFRVKPEDFKDSEGYYDFDAQTKAGVKRLVAGVAGIGAGTLLSMSGNAIVKGAGFVTMMLGASAAGSGTGQIIGSRINKKYADPKEYPQKPKSN